MEIPLCCYQLMCVKINFWQNLKVAADAIQLVASCLDECRQGFVGGCFRLKSLSAINLIVALDPVTDDFEALQKNILITFEIQIPEHFFNVERRKPINDVFSPFTPLSSYFPAL